MAPTLLTTTLSAARPLAPLDWSVILAYLLLSVLIAAYFTRRAGKNTGEFFLGGRTMGWFLAGTSMVATTFAADTPLAVTELVAKNGIAGNWLWWNMLFGNVLAVFFFARLWRRANILTDVEFIELRYSGKPAAFLRGFKAIYIGLFMNCIVLAWVNLAMIKIVQVCLPHWNAYYTVAAIMALVAIYSSMSGLMGVAVTDAFQFFLAIGGCIVLAFYAVHDAGGIATIKERLPDALRFTPVVGEQQGGSGMLSMSVAAFIAYLGVQWWASWYPGSEPGGGGYVAQRMMSAKDEKNSLFATLWFTLAHYCVRPWPWILTALAAMVLLPQMSATERASIERNPTALQAYKDVADNRVGDTANPDYATAYVMAESHFKSDPAFRERFENSTNPGGMFPKMMRDHLPTGLYGLLLAAFLAAYMSTISTQLNWGTSYLTHDFYKRFMAPEADEKQLVLVSRLLTLVMGVVSFIITTQLERVSGAWEFVLAISGGIGLVLILRWFWWRVSAWSELAAMLAPIAPYLWCHHQGIPFPASLFYIVAFSTVAWLLVTYLTPPTDRATLHTFYRRVHPGGIGWTPIQADLPDARPDQGYPALFANWLLGCALTYCTLFGLGRLIFGQPLQALAFLAAALISALIIWRNLSREDWTEPT